MATRTWIGGTGRLLIDDPANFTRRDRKDILGLAGKVRWTGNLNESREGRGAG